MVNMACEGQSPDLGPSMVWKMIYTAVTDSGKEACGTSCVLVFYCHYNELLQI